MTDIKDLIECLVAWANSSDMGRKPDLKSIPRQAASAIEALQEENALLEGTLESRGRNIAALQAENEQFRLLAKANSEALGAALVERDALQSRLDAMGKQKPVAYSVGNTLKWHEGKGMTNAQLFAAPKALAPLTDEQMRDAFAQALTDVYVCTRVWSAWSYGTMTEDDFSPASECDEVLDSLVQAAHGIGGTP